MNSLAYNKTLVYVAACIGLMFFGVAFIVMGAVLPAMTEKYALSDLDHSLLVVFIPVGVLVGSLVFGPIMDRFGYKSLLILSTMFVGIGLSGLSYCNDLVLLRLFIFIIGLGGGILNGETNAMVAELYSGNESASKLSFLGMCYGVGALTMPLVLSIFSERYSYEIILRWSNILVLLSIVYFAFIKFPKPKFKQGFPVKDALRLMKNSSLLLLSLILFFQSGLEGLFNNWTTKYLIAGGISKEQALLSLTALVAGITVARLLLTYLLAKGRTILFIYGGLFLLAAATVLLYILPPAFWLALVLLFAVGMGLAAMFPIIIGCIGTMFTSMTGTAISIAMFIALSGNSILNYLMGIFADKFKIETFPIFIIACIVLQTILILKNKNLVKGIN